MIELDEESKKLLNTFTNRLEAADEVYAKAHNGQKMSELQKYIIATWLEQERKYSNILLNQVCGTTKERADIMALHRFFYYLMSAAYPLIIEDVDKQVESLTGNK